jgi:hypothetical protein
MAQNNGDFTAKECQAVMKYLPKWEFSQKKKYDIITCYISISMYIQTNSVALNPQANYTD